MSRNSSIDYLKLALACMVVGLHTRFFQDINSTVGHLLSNGIFRVAVPTFLLINGYYYQENKNSEQKIKWLKRIFTLYIFWTLVYSPIWIFIEKSNLNISSKILKNLLIGHHHLWYLVAAIFSAILIHLIRQWPSRFKIFFFSFMYCIGVILQYITSFDLLSETNFSNLLQPHWTHRNFLFFASSFFVLGMIINDHQWHKKITPTQCRILLLFGVVALVLEAYIDMIYLQAHSGFDNFFTLIFICPAIFIFALQNPTLKNTSNLAVISSGIYFVHPGLQFFIHHFFQLTHSTLTFWVLFTSMISAVGLSFLKRRLPFIL